ncbi:MAG: SDR family oxidoreductase [Burkholderiales bacterium]|nr:SDR family oxidoreductase [Burkholderiales bacterium]
MDVQLRGKRAVITGAGAGIGRVIADAFIANGAKVHVCDVSDTALAEFRQAHPEAGASVCDVADATQVDLLFDAAQRLLGGLDILVNNAGITGPRFTRVEDMAPQDWERTLAVNINGQFYCARRAIPLLKKAGGGVILNMSSTAGRLGYPLRTPYAASKWAVIGFTQSLAMELGAHNIRVNALLPGFVDGPRSRALRASQAAERGVSMDLIEQEMFQKVSLRRRVSPNDVAAMAVFAASDWGANISGQSLGVCGNTERLV